jgi:hypothetical protein
MGKVASSDTSSGISNYGPGFDQYTPRRLLLSSTFTLFFEGHLRRADRLKATMPAIMELIAPHPASRAACERGLRPGGGGLADCEVPDRRVRNPAKVVGRTCRAASVGKTLHVVI